MSGGPDVRLLAFPLTLLGSAAVFFVPGVGDTFEKSQGLRDSSVWGAGYEPVLKADGGFKAGAKAGTKSGTKLFGKK